MSAVAQSRRATAAREAGERSTAPDASGVRLIVFAAFAAFASLHWSMLVADVPFGQTVLIAAVALACAGLLVVVGHASLPRGTRMPLAALVVLVALVLGLVVTGVAPRLLLPSGWGVLADGIDRGLLAVQSVGSPYDGPDEWVRLTILLGAPLLLTIAAALAFWPAAPEARPPLRAAALILLLALYGIATTTHDPGVPLERGAVLLALIAAWLWLPRLGQRETAIAVATVASVSVLAVPLAAALDGDGPWFDYRSWAPFGDPGLTFDWSHEYGPLDWPRQGTLLFKARSDRPHYWKAETLDDFDGVRWHDSPSDEADDVTAELPFRDGDGDGDEDWEYGERNPDWDYEIRFTVRALSTDLLVGVGLTNEIDGVAAVPTAEGSTRLIGDPLERGDTYTVEAYEPDPDRLELIGAPSGYDEEDEDDFLASYATLTLPPAADEASIAGRRTVVVPLRGNPTSTDRRAEVEELLESSAYGQTYQLARALTDDRGSVYDAVKAIETHLQDSYRYSERVPEHVYPLESFLFEDLRGYCQQFSGAMALMLRMVGIPARVAAGFSPGTFNRKSGEYLVRDLDAHSWVEVYFNGIGWVPFDPTPSVAPAESQSTGALATSAASADAGEIRAESSGPASPSEEEDGGDSSEQEPEVTSSSAAASDADGGSGSPAPGLIGLGALAVLALGAGVAFGVRIQRVRALSPERLADAQLAELRRALDRLGWDAPPATTLLAVERQLADTADPAAAAYAGALRAFRFDQHGATLPGPTQRRALRRALAARPGPLRRLRALVAIPPGGPAVD